MKELEELLGESDDDLLVQLGFVSEALASEPELLLIDGRGSSEHLERALSGEDGRCCMDQTIVASRPYP
jgi:hypothetical protein